MAQNSACKATTATVSKPAPRNKTKPAYTLERAIMICPSEGLAANLVRTFALEDVDFHQVRETTEEMLVKTADLLRANLNDKALETHMQRIVGAYVGSACSAGDFYGNKVSDARALTSRLSNDSRDEDREPVYGFDSKAARAREFAATVGLQAYALLASAQGAIDAFAHVTGSDWKPYQQSQTADRNVPRQAAQAELEAFGSA